jgi:hypothetical protein
MLRRYSSVPYISSRAPAACTTSLAATAFLYEWYREKD